MSNDIEMTTLRYTIVGPHAGQTVKYQKGKYSFINGVLEVEVREDQVDKFKGLTRLLARCYNAHPAGSKALERAQAEWAAATGGKNAGGQKADNKKAEARGKASDGEANAGAKAGAEGHGTEGGDGVGAGEGDDSEPSEVAVALGQLDPNNDKHWTSTGMPNLKVVGEFLGRSVTRPELEEAVPGFTRESAAATE